MSSDRGVPVTGQGEGGAVLGEEARMQLELFEQSVRGELTLFVGSGGDWFETLVDRIVSNPHLAALVDQARADGAAEERKRITKAIEAEPRTSAEDGAMRVAAAIARSRS